MAKAALAKTAKIAAAGRARESERPDRLFDDPLAAVLAGPEGFAWRQSWRPPGMTDDLTIAARTRFFDDLITLATSEGTRQVVLVAAGLDTRAFRLSLPDDAVVFELDQGPLLGYKQLVLDLAGAAAVCRRVPVPVDLAGPTWPKALVDAGLDTSRPCVVVEEGLSWYLTEAENSALLYKLASLAAPGSRLGVDMVGRTFMDGQAMAPFLELLSSKGAQWRFGTDNPRQFLETHGWAASVSDFHAVARTFGRWPPAGMTESTAAGIAREAQIFFVSAEVLPTSPTALPAAGNDKSDNYVP